MTVSDASTTVRTVSRFIVSFSRLLTAERYASSVPCVMSW